MKPRTCNLLVKWVGIPIAALFFVACVLLSWPLIVRDWHDIVEWWSR
jgi:hypothetical protein